MPDAGADLARNRALWTVVNAQFTDADRSWEATELTWAVPDPRARPGRPR
jgi:hypothetical protein